MQTKKSKLLIDIGLSLKELKSRLELINTVPEDIDAVIVSHEHTDHIRGVGAFSRRYGTNIYINYPTLKKAAYQIKKIKNIHEFDSAEKFVINDVTITPFSVSHDAADPVGFTIETDGRKIGIATDLGVATNLVKTNLIGCDLLIIESNHDREMMMNGPYPWFLKQRIRSRHGHLSNNDALELISEVICEKTKHVMLAHLSETNNNEEKVCNNVIDLYKKRVNNNVEFMITSQESPAALIEI